MRVLTPVTALLAAGALGSAVLAASLTGTLAGFTAVLTQNGVSTNGTIVLQETGPSGAVCTSTDGSGNSVATNTASCTSINEFTGASLLVPSSTWTTTTVVLKNLGTANASSLQVASGGCTQSGNVAGSATDLCTQLLARVSTVGANGTTSTVYSGSLGGLGTVQLGALASQATTTVRFELNLPQGSGNGYQGLVATVPFTWTLAS